MRKDFPTIPTKHRHQIAFSRKHSVYYLDTILQNGKLLNKFIVVSKTEIRHTGTSMLRISPV